MREKSGERDDRWAYQSLHFSYIFRFGEDSVEKMVGWTLENVPAASGPQILEIGSGNGTLLFALRDAGYAASHLTGLDYSLDAVKLARLIASTRNSEEIAFRVGDFLRDSPPLTTGRPDASGRWDLLLDKGTYDAISLGDKDGLGRSPQEAYPGEASRLLKEGGYILITCKPKFNSIPRVDRFNSL